MNPHERLAREQKASAIAATLAKHGFSADEASAFDAGQRGTAALAAHQRTPSAQTWQLVVERLSERALSCAGQVGAAPGLPARTVLPIRSG
jgi:hypothetical protein